MRATWTETWMSVAYSISRRSLCYRSQAGCVIVSSDQRVVSTGYNGPPPSFQHNDQDCRSWCPRTQTGGQPANYDDCLSVHAEENALARASWLDMADGTIYITRVPCYGCAKRIAGTNLANAVFIIAAADADRQPERSIAVLRDHGTKVTIIDG